jgi:hemoglobin
MGSQIPTIYEWAGGRPAFERWLGRFYDLVENDELISPLFGGKVRDQYRRDVVTWWCEVLGGPAAYTDHLGGYEHMLWKHRGLHITSEQRLRFVTLLSRAADGAGLPADPEFRWATPSGVRGWRCTIPAMLTISSSTRPFLVGVGAWRRPTSRNHVNVRGKSRFAGEAWWARRTRTQPSWWSMA